MNDFSKFKDRKLSIEDAVEVLNITEWHNRKNWQRECNLCRNIVSFAYSNYENILQYSLIEAVAIAEWIVRNDYCRYVEKAESQA